MTRAVTMASRTIRPLSNFIWLHQSFPITLSGAGAGSLLPLFQCCCSSSVFSFSFWASSWWQILPSRASIPDWGSIWMGQLTTGAVASGQPPGRQAPHSNAGNWHDTTPTIKLEDTSLLHSWRILHQYTVGGCYNNKHWGYYPNTQLEDTTSLHSSMIQPNYKLNYILDFFPVQWITCQVKT